MASQPGGEADKAEPRAVPKLFSSLCREREREAAEGEGISTAPQKMDNWFPGARRAPAPTEPPAVDGNGASFSTRRDFQGGLAAEIMGVWDQGGCTESNESAPGCRGQGQPQAGQWNRKQALKFHPGAKVQVGSLSLCWPRLLGAISTDLGTAFTWAGQIHTNVHVLDTQGGLRSCRMG